MSIAGRIPALISAIAALAAALALGCAGPGFEPHVVTPGALTASAGAAEQAARTLADWYPPRFKAAQRAILTVHGRQFALDGILDSSPETGRHLAIVSALGLVCEARITPSGAVELLRTTPLMRENWSREYVAQTLRLLFVPPPGASFEGLLPDGRLALNARTDPGARYIFDPSGTRVEAVEILRNGHPVWQARFGDFRALPGRATPTPFEFEVRASAFRLELRTVSWKEAP